MSDYHVKVKVRNGRIIRRMRQQGIKSVVELARLARADLPTLYKIISMELLPTDRNGDWRDIVLGVSSALRCQPEDLFNEQRRSTPLQRSSGETFMDAAQVAMLAADGIEATDAKLTVQKLLANLSERERSVVEAHAEGASYGDIAADWRLSVERVRQIEAKALRKMRGQVVRDDRKAAWRAIIQQ